MEWGLGRGFDSPQENKMNFIRKVCCNSCDALLADLQGACKARLAPLSILTTHLMIQYTGRIYFRGPHRNNSVMHFNGDL